MPLSKLPSPPSPMGRDDVTETEKVVLALLRWADAKCPCENEQPDPCPLCGASVENLDGCKAADNTLPPSLLLAAREVKARIQKTPGAK